MRTQNIGAMTIDRVAEIDRMMVDPEWLYPNITEEMVLRRKDELGELFVDPITRKFILSFHSYVIRTPYRTILVDTCNGNHKHRPTNPWQHNLESENYLANLARIGLSPVDIDIVLCTHLHTDHVGWNTKLVDGRWVPTFPNAKYVMARIEFEHYSRLHAANPERPVGHGSFLDSVLPIAEAGRAELVDMNHAVERHLDDCVWLEPATGHTPGHVTVHVKGRNGHAIMSGDMIHHPILLAEPNLVSLGDFDPAQARKSLQDLLHRCVDTQTTLLPAHFPSPTAGRIVSHRGEMRFRLLDE